MPPAKKAPVRICSGAGMTAGLEIHRTADGALLLHDTTTDGRFADDVATWRAHLNQTATKKRKNAAQ
jgi:hypothetical protein